MKRKPYKVGPVTRRSMPFWCVGNPLGDPFGEKVLSVIDSEEVAGILAWAADKGLIEGTSFHDDDLVPWDPENPQDDLDPNSEAYKKLRAIRKVLRKAGLVVNTSTCNLHTNRIFRKGGVTNPDPAVRDLARQKVERSVRIGNLFGAKHFTYWVARDGFEVPAAVDWANVYRWLADGLNHVYDYIQEQGFTNYIGGTVEPKPNEPRGHMFLPSSGHAVGFICSQLKPSEFWGVNPELLQHEGMTLMNSVLTLSYLVSAGKLFFLHFGSQIKAQFDNDFPPLVGPEGLKETVMMFHTLKQLKWKGVVEFDCHMLRTEGDPEDPIGCRKQFIINCINALSISLLLADRVKGAPGTLGSETAVDLAATMQLCGVTKKAVKDLSRKKN